MGFSMASGRDVPASRVGSGHPSEDKEDEKNKISLASDSALSPQKAKPSPIKTAEPPSPGECLGDFQTPARTVSIAAGHALCHEGNPAVESPNVGAAADKGDSGPSSPVHKLFPNMKLDTNVISPPTKSKSFTEGAQRTAFEVETHKKLDEAAAKAKAKLAAATDPKKPELASNSSVDKEIKEHSPAATLPRTGSKGKFGEVLAKRETNSNKPDPSDKSGPCWKWAHAQKQLRETVLTEKEKSKLERGVILLKDAWDGRSSHGLYSLLDGPAWKRVLFKIQTADWWQNGIIFANLIHAGLIFLESPNFRSSWIDGDLDAVFVKLIELCCIGVYAADVVMKMMYFGGWSDYVSKQWQRNYLIIISAFLVDLGLYTAKLSSIRFTRPFRLFITVARSRDVRRLANFLIPMAQKLWSVLTVPMLGLLASCGFICVRVWGNRPPGGEATAEFGNNHFRNIFMGVENLFMLSTLDNFDPIVTESFKLAPISFCFFFPFIILATFFLMSLALAAVFDLYVEDHEKTVAAEAKKEDKSLTKAFAKLDLDADGKIGFVHFREMLRTLRPQDKDDKHAWMIFKTIAKELDGEAVIDREMFSNVAHIMNVSFKSLKDSNHPASSEGHLEWATWENRAILLDSLILLSNQDGVLLCTILFSQFELHMTLGTVLLAVAVCQFVFLARTDMGFFRHMMRLNWRRADLALISLSVVCHLLLLRCDESAACRTSGFCANPWRKVLEMLEGLRFFRAFLHHPASRRYVMSLLQVAPVLMHMGGLILTSTYTFAVISMEVFSQPPAILYTDNGVKLNDECSNPLPNFDCFSNAMVSVFQLFLGANWGSVLSISGNPAVLENASFFWKVGTSMWFTAGYIFFGIGLCNVLTALVVEFYKVLVVEAQERARASMRNKVRMVGVKAAVRMKKVAGAFGITKEKEEEPEPEDLEVMNGYKDSSTTNWRKRLQEASEGRAKDK